MAEPVAFKYRAFISYSHADTSLGQVAASRARRLPHRQGPRRPRDRDGHDPQDAAPHLPRPRRLHRRPYALRADARRARRLGRADRHLLAGRRQEPLRQRGDQALQVAASRAAGHPADRRRQAGRSRARMLPARAQVQARCRRTDHRRAVELLAADAREEGDGKNLALAKVVAGLLGVSSDDIFRRAERERRRKGRVRNGIIAVLADSCRRRNRQRRLCLAAAQDQRGLPHRDASRPRPRSSIRPSPRPRNMAFRAPRRSPCSPRPKACSTTWRCSAARRRSCATRRPGC